jgi:hypothetical protein
MNPRDRKDALRTYRVVLQLGNDQSARHAYVVRVVPELDFAVVLEGHDRWKSTREKAQNEACDQLATDLGGDSSQARKYRVVETRYMRSPVD